MGGYQYVRMDLIYLWVNSCRCVHMGTCRCWRVCEYAYVCGGGRGWNRRMDAVIGRQENTSLWVGVYVNGWVGCFCQCGL